jgi:hypothetical protein
VEIQKKQFHQWLIKPYSLCAKFVIPKESQISLSKINHTLCDAYSVTNRAEKQSTEYVEINQRIFFKIPVSLSLPIAIVIFMAY